MKKITDVTVLLVLFSCLIGCSRQKLPDGMPPLIPCKVVVMMNDQPVDQAAIVLFPEDKANSNWSAGGITNTQGSLVVHTLGKYKGIPAGKYKVTVKKQIIDAPPEGLSFQELRAWKPGPTVELVNPKFGRLSSTPLTLDTESLNGGVAKFVVEAP